MKKILQIFSILTISLSFQVFADNLRNSNRVFDWAERAYSQYFSPTEQETFEASGYLARYYPESQTYLGTKDGRVYVFGDVFGGLVDVGELSNFVNLLNSADDVTFNENFIYPDGVTNRTYSFAIEPETGTAPFSFKLRGVLPNGLTLDEHSGLIQGTPTERGYNKFSILIEDVYGKFTLLTKAINIYDVLSFGEHGTFKGCNGLQMALNATQDLSEIRIEKGTYECTGLELSSNKEFEHGIKISGGWDSNFELQSNDPALTVFDGGAPIISNIDNLEACEAVSGIWISYKCFYETPTANRIMYFSSGPVKVEMMSFHNAVDSGGSAIIGRTDVGNVIDSCIFINNSAATYGGFWGRGSGAVRGMNTISNSTFTNNSTSSGGGAVDGARNILNSTFSNNTSSTGGAVQNVNYSYNIINSIFTKNSAGQGGAVYGNGHIENSTFTDNIADRGGAIYVDRSNSIVNSKFSYNTAITYGGAISGYIGSEIQLFNSLLNGNIVTKGDGGAIFGKYKTTIVNSILANNSASKTGGAFYGSAIILNSIFDQNTANGELNDITPFGELSVDYTLVNYIDGVFDYGTHNIMGDPRFIDFENDNYHLSSDSPVIDMGDPSVLELYEFPTDTLSNEVDFDGNQRIIGNSIDIGAYEYQ